MLDAADDPILELTVDSEYVFSYYDGEATTHILEVPPRIIDGSVMVPARFIAEHFTYEVSWDSINRIVSLSSLYYY